MLRSHTPNAVTVHWSKDFVEHLRTVHFTLIAVAVGLILILSRTNSPALAQIRQIVALKEEWPPGDLESLPQARRVHLPGEEWKTIVARSLPWNRIRYVEIEFDKNSEPPSDVPRRLAFRSPIWEPIGPYGDWEKVAEFPKTVSAFRDWWYALQIPHPCFFPTEIEDEGTLKSAKVKGEVVRFRVKDPDVGTDSVDLQNVPDLRWVSPPPKSWFRATAPFSVYQVPVTEVVKVSLDQDAVVAIARGHGWNWTQGPFEKSFSALAQETSGLEAEDLEQVEKVVAERLSNRSEQFEAFGMKFPITQVTVWGTVILLGVQLYFFLYLQQLSGKLGHNDPGWDVPWICLSQSFLARMIFFTTVILLPTATMFLIGFRASLRLTAGYRLPDSWRLLIPIRSWGLGTWLAMGAYCLAGVCSAVLGILSWRFRPRLNETAGEHCPAQLFE